MRGIVLPLNGSKARVEGKVASAIDNTGPPLSWVKRYSFEGRFVMLLVALILPLCRVNQDSLKETWYFSHLLTGSVNTATKKNVPRSQWHVRALIGSNGTLRRSCCPISLWHFPTPIWVCKYSSRESWACLWWRFSSSFFDKAAPFEWKNVAHAVGDALYTLKR